MTESILDSLFKLPPPEKRGVPAWAPPMFGRQSGLRRYDDVFVFYLAMRTSFIVAFALFLANVVSQAAQIRLNFYLFSIDLRGRNFVQTFLHTYTDYTSTILLFLVLPYYIFVWNRNFDNMVCSTPVTRGSTYRGARRFFLAVFFVMIACVGTYGSCSLFDLSVDTYHNENSYRYFFFCGAALSVSLAFLNSIFVVLTLAFFFDMRIKPSR